MAALAGGNVNNTVFNILTQKGYRVWMTTDAKFGLEFYWAEKDGWDFCADTPCALLGLITIFEYRKPEHYYPYWWQEEGALNEDNIPATSPDYVPVVTQIKNENRIKNTLYL